MTPYAEIWHLTRDRLNDVYLDLNEEQLHWRPCVGGHSTLEYLFHVAGVELYYITVLTDKGPEGDYENKIYNACASTFLKEGDFPFKNDELTKENAGKVLAYTSDRFGPLIENPSEELLNKPIISAQGANTDGRGAFIRAAQHAGYHTGQIYLMRCLRDFPK